MAVGAETPARPSLTPLEARVQGGPAVDDEVRWRSDHPRPSRRRVCKGRVAGFDGEGLIVEYALNMGRGAVMTRQITIRREQLIDES